MCGGHIHYDNDASVATCEFCGTEQTIVKTDDLKKLNLFNRANALRLQNEFDKAQTTYENILIDDPSNAEAHWGICLCRYGIEYVSDKKTNKKVPTCHRTVYKFIYDDLDYLEAINNADVVAKKMYEAEAKVIDKIQKNILEISQKEEPYDIFICYKETDNFGNRTKDSVIAENIYNELTKEGYKVFYSKISLESKLGSEYEPVIFAALMSAKVMLVIGSKIEYINAPWVKNEWGRFISFMKDMQNKYLIPCYIDMEAYDLPEEFLMLQAQDLSKIGYMQDLTRGISKLFSRTIKGQTTPNNSKNSPKIDNILRRVELCFEDQDFDKANELLEDILNMDVECEEAYLYKILANRKLKNVDELKQINEPLDNDKDFIKALRFSTEEYRAYLLDINKEIKEGIEYRSKNEKYKEAKRYLNQGKYVLAIQLFKEVSDFKDSNNYLDLAIKKAYDLAKSLCENNDNYYEALVIFNELGSYQDSIDMAKHCNEEISYENSKRKALQCKGKLDEIISRSLKYNLISGKDEELIKLYLYTELPKLTKYEKAKEIIDEYEIKIDDVRETIKENREKAIIRAKKRANRIKILSIVGLMASISFIALVISLLVYESKVVAPKKSYEKANSYLSSGNYKMALYYYQKTDYSDSKSKIKLLHAREYIEFNNYEKAIDVVYEMGGTTNISYDADGGTSIKKSEVIKQMKINNEVQKENLEFREWALQSYDIDYDNYILNLNLVATYNPKLYTVTYKGIDYEIDESYPTTFTYDGTETWISVPNAHKKGYTFLGWVDDINVSPQVDYHIYTHRFKDLELTAKWKRDEYKININTTGGKIDGDEFVTVEYDEFYSMPVPTQEGFKFLGYAVDDGVDDRVTYLTNSSGESLRTYQYVGTINAIAIWEVGRYTYTFVATEGGSILKEYVIEANYLDKLYNYSKATDEDEYVFVGWYADGVKISANEQLVIYAPGHDTTFVATYEKKQ